MSVRKAKIKSNYMCNKSSKFFTHFVGIIVAGLTIAAMYYTILDRREPVEIVEAIISPHKARVGSTITVSWSARALRDCTGIVRRYIVDHSDIRHPYVDAPVVIRNPNNLGSLEMFSRQLALPTNMAIGTAYYNSEVRYICNPFHQYFPIISSRPTITFEVIP